jgi:hypothetical protein
MLPKASSATPATTAKAEKVAPGSDWYIPLRTADAEVWLQENGRVHTVQKSA